MMLRRVSGRPALNRVAREDLFEEVIFDLDPEA